MNSYTKHFTISITILLLLGLGCVIYNAMGQKRDARSHPYVSEKPLIEPKLFAESVINTDADEYGPTFTPDGQTLYFARRVNRKDSEFIVVSRFKTGKWSAPEVAEFSGKHFDKEPFVSPDGSKLFFSSKRPSDGTTPKQERDFDLWYVERTAEGWGEPLHLGPEINTPNYENYPAVASNGNLYFASVREGGRGQNDLYRSRFVNGKYLPAESLGDAINTPYSDADPYIAPDESYLIYSASPPTGYGEGDLYISFNRNGKWTRPVTLGAKLNTSEYEYTPLVSPDGKYLFFSRGWGEIYQVEMSALNLDGLKQAAISASDPQRLSSLPNASKVIERYAQLIGGTDAASKLTTRVMKGTVTIRDKTGTIETAAKAPNKLVRRSDVPGLGVVLEGFNGTTAWAQDPRGAVTEMGGAVLGMIRRESEFHREIKLSEFYTRTKLTGTEDIRGREAYVVEALTTDSVNEKLFFDKQTGLLVMREFEMETPQGRRPFVFTYDDYREVDKTRLPFTISRLSPSSWTMKFTEVKHNVPLEDAIFDKPAQQK
jgi:Tol biopolymer transport system component